MRHRKFHLSHHGAGYADARLPAAQGQPCSDMQHQQGCFGTPGVQASPLAATACTADSAKASRSTGGCRAAAGAAPGRPQVGSLTNAGSTWPIFTPCLTAGMMHLLHSHLEYSACKSHPVAECPMLHSSATAPARFCASVTHIPYTSIQQRSVHQMLNAQRSGHKIWQATRLAFCCGNGSYFLVVR